MKIVIATPILYDATSPYNHLFRDMLEGWLQAGHQVVRIAAVEHAGDTAYQMGIDSPAITYIPVVRKRRAKANIIVRYLTDTLTNIRMAFMLKKTGADVLFEDVSYSSFWSVFAAKKCGMKVVSMLQDIWPDNAVHSGLMAEGSLMYRYFEWWQRMVYRRSDSFITISDDMKAFIVNKGVKPDRIRVICNWGYGDDKVNIPFEDNAFVKAQGLSPDTFYAVYAGNIGRMQNVELVVNAAALLQHREDIRFLVIGDGVARETIEQLAAPLSNVTMFPLQPSELATSIYSAAGVNLIPLVDGGVKTALPSKTGVCLSCGRPVIFCFGENCAFADTVRAYKAGDCVSATDPQGLADAIAALADNRTAECAGAYRLFGDRFTKEANVRQYVEELETI